MFQAMRQTVRLASLAIGFVLFVVMAIYSANSVNDRTAVVGKPMRWLTQQAGLSSTLRQPTQPTAQLQVVASQSKATSVAAKPVSAQTEPGHSAAKATPSDHVAITESYNSQPNNPPEKDKSSAVHTAVNSRKEKD